MMENLYLKYDVFVVSLIPKSVLVTSTYMFCIIHYIIDCSVIGHIEAEREIVGYTISKRRKNASLHLLMENL
jgi:hypothetical protein